MPRPKPKRFTENYDRFKKSQKHEKRLAKEYGGHRIPRSGGMPWSAWNKGQTANGDISTDHFHIEHKSTERDSIGLKYEWLQKVREGALASMKEPMVIITFVRNVKHIDEWVVVPRDVFDSMMEAGSDEDE